MGLSEVGEVGKAVVSVEWREGFSRMVKKLEWIEMAQLAVSSIPFKSLSLKLP